MPVAQWETRVSRAMRRLASTTHDEPGLEDFWESCVDTIATVVPFDACFLSAADPVSLQFSAGTHVRNLPAQMAPSFMRNEFLEDDVNTFTHMHARGVTVSTLHDATSGEPERSTRYRDVLRPNGFGPELRALISDGRTTWGYATLLRELGAPEFTDGEQAAVEHLCLPLALALRASLRWSSDPPARLCSPGTITVDLTGEFVTVSDQARRALDGVCAAPIQAVAASAIARHQGREVPPPKARLRTIDGEWLTVRGDTVTDGHGQVTHASIVLEASPITHVASILARACALTRREETVLAHIARGVSTREIARELFISEHTVRDHVKSIFTKTGTHSRGELVHQFFALDP